MLCSPENSRHAKRTNAGGKSESHDALFWYAASGTADRGSPRPTVRPTPVPEEETRVKRQPPYAVVLYNDDVNGFDYVVDVLQKVFRYGQLKAFWLTLKAHVCGQSVVWTGSLEVAELKAEQMRSCGPDPRKRDCGGLPLHVSVEPLPN
jgi:ATP-dependent Clp protease adaptor protein ClpS